MQPQQTVEEMFGNTDLKGERTIPPDGPRFISADQAVKTIYLWVNNVSVSRKDMCPECSLGSTPLVYTRHKALVAMAQGFSFTKASHNYSEIANEIFKTQEKSVRRSM